MKKIKVLVVDDEPMIREILEKILSINDFEVITVSSADEGLIYFKENLNDIQLITTDYSMPGMDLKQFIFNINILKKDVNIIIISGLSKDYIHKNIHKDKVFDIIEKPFSSNELLKSVNNAVK
jgi:DNA-binding NtrC family response regulator